MRFSLRGLLLVIVIDGSLSGMALRHFLMEKPQRYSVLGPLCTGGTPNKLPPPSAAEVIRSMGVSVGQVSVSQMQLLREHADPAKVYPLVGSARLHTATYQYDVNLGGRKLVIIVDHIHLHCSEQPDGKPASL